MSTESDKITKLEQQVALLIRQNKELNQRVGILERENNRRRSETAQLASAIRKG